MLSRKVRIVVFCILFFLITITAVSCRGTVFADSIREAIVKVYTVYNAPHYYNPWDMRGPSSRSGSGALIEDNLILTNAHMVSDATFIQVRRYGETRRYQAEMEAVSHESDLALLRVQEPEVFSNIEPLQLGDLPEVHKEVEVYGFPVGGDMLSITKGIVSRIEHQSYIHSSSNLLAAQIDAAINPGNSGGPAISDGKITGIAMQGIPRAQNIGYIIPVNIIEHFLEGIQQGDYRGFPSLGILMQKMENEDMRIYYGMAEEQTGMLITEIFPGASSEGIILPGDILLMVDDKEVANDGTVEFRPRERTAVSYAVQEKQLGEKIDIEVLRAGEILELEITLDRPAQENWLVPMEQYDVLPSYYIYGGFVFAPLNKNLLQIWGDNWRNSAPIELVYQFSNNVPEVKGEEVVILLRVLASGISEGYQDYSFWNVYQVNGIRVRNMKQLVNIIENNTEPYIILSNRSGNQIILDHNKVIENQEQILNLYRIGQDRSADLFFNDD